MAVKGEKLVTIKSRKGHKRLRSAVVTQEALDQNHGFIGGLAFTRPRKQFQAIYLLVGTLKNAVTLADDLVSWPNFVNPDGTPHRPQPHGYLAWAQLIDDGKETVPPEMFKAMKQRLDSYTEMNIRLAINSHANATRKLANKLATDMDLTDQQRKAMKASADATGFMYGNTFGKKMPAEEKPRKIGATKVKAAVRREPPPANVTEVDFGQSASS